MLEIIVNGKNESLNISVKKEIEKAIYTQMGMLCEEAAKEEQKENPDMILVNNVKYKVAKLTEIKESIKTKGQEEKETEELIKKAASQTVERMNNTYGENGW